MAQGFMASGIGAITLLSVAVLLVSGYAVAARLKIFFRRNSDK